jgi:hypothetical protein
MLMPIIDGINNGVDDMSPAEAMKWRPGYGDGVGKVPTGAAPGGGGLAKTVDNEVDGGPIDGGIMGVCRNKAATTSSLEWLAMWVLTKSTRILRRQTGHVDVFGTSILCR